MNPLLNGECIDLWSELDANGKPIPSTSTNYFSNNGPALSTSQAKEDASIKLQHILVCARSSDPNEYVVYSDLEKNYVMKFRSEHKKLTVGKFYIVEEFTNGKTMCILPLNVSSCEVNVIERADCPTPVIVARANIFIGTLLADGRHYICYNEFFGRAYFGLFLVNREYGQDASRTAMKVEQFKSYFCIMYSTLEKNVFECNWQIRHIIQPCAPLRYYVLEVQLESIDEEEGNIYCVRNDMIILLRKEDLQQCCCADLVELMTVHVIAFKNQPHRSSCHMYRSCYATLVDDFTEELTAHSLIPAEIMTRCCDDKTQRRAALLAQLMSNVEFLTTFLDLDQSLRERLFRTMMAGSFSRT